MDLREKAKKAAAIAATKHVKEGFTVGLGSGTTIAYALQELGKKTRSDQLRILGVPTSHQTFLLAIKHRIPLTTLDEHPQLDITLDGADQVDESLNTIKGMGGALTREKVVASASKSNIIVVDEAKLTKELGKGQPVPIEVLPFALSTATLRLQTLGGKPALRQAERKLGPVVTDNGNFILDVSFGPIDKPERLNQELKAIPGIVETGLFVDMADIVYIGRKDTVKKLTK